MWAVGASQIPPHPLHSQIPPHPSHIHPTARTPHAPACPPAHTHLCVSQGDAQRRPQPRLHRHAHGQAALRGCGQALVGRPQAPLQHRIWGPERVW